MAATRTPGITIDANGSYMIGKRYRGGRIGMRVGAVGQAQPKRACEPKWRRSIASAARLHDRTSEIARRSCSRKTCTVSRRFASTSERSSRTSVI